MKNATTLIALTFSLFFNVLNGAQAKTTPQSTDKGSAIPIIEAQKDEKIKAQLTEYHTILAEDGAFSARAYNRTILIQSISDEQQRLASVPDTNSQAPKLQEYLTSRLRDFGNRANEEHGQKIATEQYNRAVDTINGTMEDGVISKGELIDIKFVTSSSLYTPPFNADAITQVVQKILTNLDITPTESRTRALTNDILSQYVKYERFVEQQKNNDAKPAVPSQ